MLFELARAGRARLGISRSGESPRRGREFALDLAPLLRGRRQHRAAMGRRVRQFPRI